MERKLIRPQDILVLSKLIELKNDNFLQQDISKELGISQSEIVHCLNRLDSIGLYNKKSKSINKLSVIEFIEHAVKFIFPMEIKSYTRGIATGDSSPFLKKKIMKNDIGYVWPSENGKVSGLGVVPLYHTIPRVVEGTSILRILLNIIDIYRGPFSSRVKKEASIALQKIVLGIGNG